MKHLLRIPVDDMSQAGETRRLTVPLCRMAGFSDVDIGHVSLIVTEMASNLVKHSNGGELLLRSLECGGVMGFEILSIDRGPGMANPSRSVQDGVSTTGSPGTGLGAIMRASSQFDLFSEPGKGTVIMSRYSSGVIPKDLPPRPLEIGAVCLPMLDEGPCGDGWAAEQTGLRSRVLVVDGLGHGPDAAEAAREAERLFRHNKSQSVQEIVEALHAGLRSTRGAVLAVLEADHANGVVRYCGIGNIAARIIAGGADKNLVSHNGTAGHEAHKIQEFTYPWNGSGLLIMHSDGISGKWRLDDYPGLAGHHPAVVAAVLYRDFKRERDDRTVVVARQRGNSVEGVTP